MAGLPDDGDAAEPSENKTVRRRDDDLDIVAQPSCPECGTTMRDTAVGFECAWCETTVTVGEHQSEMPSDFDGPAIRGG